MKRGLTPRQAWREIARRLEKNDCCTGLCAKISDLCREGLIEYDTTLEMRTQLADVFDAPLGNFLWPIGHVTPRIVAATLLAEGADA